MSVATNSHIASPEAPEQQISALAVLCKALADPLRLQVLRVLSRDSFSVSELCSIFSVRQPALSHHLKVLAAAELVGNRREGNSIFYRRRELGRQHRLESLRAQAFSAVDEVSIPVQIESRLQQLQLQREANSRNFFRDNADKFHQQQDLIASYHQYAETVADVLRDAPLAERGTVLEVGPGDGAFLSILSPQFKRVVAVDSAAQMLDRARRRCADAGLDNIEFVHGDTTAAKLDGLQADCAVVNMVLHHTPDPGQVVMDVASRLNDRGVMVVTDLCQHDQGWARENCGDLWLGFEPQQLADWAAAAGLGELASVYLAQRNGFQLQVRLFGHR